MSHAVASDTHSLTPQYSNEAAERMYVEWDAALSSNDPERLLACYAPDAVLESPLVPHLMGTNDGACRGHEQLRAFFQLVAKRKPGLRHYFRKGSLPMAGSLSGSIRAKRRMASRWTLLNQ